VGRDRGEVLQLAVRGVQIRRAAPEGGGHGVKGLVHPTDLVPAAERRERHLTLGQALGVLHHGVKTPADPPAEGIGHSQAAQKRIELLAQVVHAFAAGEGLDRGNGLLRLSRLHETVQLAEVAEQRVGVIGYSADAQPLSRVAEPVP
jgi:hypothetical protein